MTLAYVATLGMLAIAVVIMGKRGAAALGNAASTAAQAVNPFNHDNIFAQGVNATVQSISGEPGVTLGTKIGDAVDRITSIITGEPTPGEQATAPSNAPGTPSAGSGSFPAPSIAVGRIGQYEIGL